MANDLSTTEDIMAIIDKVKNTSGPEEVGISRKAFDEVSTSLQDIGRDDVAFFAGVGVGVMLERSKRDE